MIDKNKYKLQAIGDTLDQRVILLGTLKERIWKYKKRETDLLALVAPRMNIFNYLQVVIEKEEVQYEINFVNERISELNRLLVDIDRELQDFLPMGVQYDVGNFTVWNDGGKIEFHRNQ